ncbi:MAG: glutamate--tRNA ligase [Aquificaceae bacterium]
MIRARFAPSPTGFLHLGNARTAIINYLFAKSQNGKFILRIEDTDKERSKKEFENELLRDLQWLGIEWDEFYRQSERYGIYKDFALGLLRENLAYRCFCTPEEIEKERSMALAKGVPYKYSGKCRALTPSMSESLAKEQKPFTIRFKTPPDLKISFIDAIKGRVEFSSDELDDFVILRSDMSPTYNFAVVVDDALMDITHVIRGEDHLSNTPKQILIYKALKFKEPTFAHLPVILGQDRSKLSKRHGAVSISAFREAGYPPEAVFNYLALLGFAIPEGQKEILSKEELINNFDLSKIGSSPAIFSYEKIKWLSGQYIRNYLPIERVCKDIKEFLNEEFDEEYLCKVISKIRDSFETYAEGVQKLRIFSLSEIELNGEITNELKPLSGLLQETIKLLEKEGFSKEGAKRAVKTLQQNLGIKQSEIWKALRLALTGERQGISMDIVFELLPERIIKLRLEGALRC